MIFILGPTEISTPQDEQHRNLNTPEKAVENGRLADKPKFLIVGDFNSSDTSLVDGLSNAYDVVAVSDKQAALAKLSTNQFSGIYILPSQVQSAFGLGKFLENERILESIPDGVVVLDSTTSIIWGNDRFKQWVNQEIVGQQFYSLLDEPEILGPELCVFRSVLATGNSCRTTLKTKDNKFYNIHAAPLLHGNPIAADDSASDVSSASAGTSPHDGHLIVTIRDVTYENLEGQKRAEIHQAGISLGDLTPEELMHMKVEDRINLLKDDIIRCTQDILKFDVIEIRLLDRKTLLLDPLLSVGLKPEAVGRKLFARPHENGVTGFVAATKQSYMCENISQDPLYIEGCQDAKSSLTVPLILHDEVVGTFNVESPNPHAFSESDLEFLEIFGRDVAAALNTLELLVAEQAIIAAENTEAIHSAVAMPVDDILNDAVNIMQYYMGKDQKIAAKVQRILQNARYIKKVIQNVGRQMAPSLAHPKSFYIEERPFLENRRVLVVDAEDNIRLAAHELLDRYGCIVETAHDGAEAVAMVISTAKDEQYDVIISDIRLPDFSGYQLFLKLRDIMGEVPLILMTGFGYDPGHSIVKARQAGLKEVLFKPFRLDQLLEKVERVLGVANPTQ